MRWHYISGLVFGVLALTWVFSGLLSMEPFGWASGEGLSTRELRQALVGGPLDASGFPQIDVEAWDTLLPGRTIKEITYTRILGEPYFMVRSTPAKPAGATTSDQVAGWGIASPGDARRALVAAETLEVRREPFAVDALMARVREDLSGRSDRRSRAPRRVRLLPLLPRPAGPVADPAPQIRRPQRDMALHRSGIRDGYRPASTASTGSSVGYTMAFTAWTSASGTTTARSGISVSSCSASVGWPPAQSGCL